MIRASAILLACLLCAPQEQVDNPEYKSWAKYKVGTTITRKVVTDSNGQKHETIITSKLVTSTADKVEIEESAVSSLYGKKDDTKTERRTILPKMKAPEPRDGPKPKEGDEMVAVGGKSYKCHWVYTESEGADNSKSNGRVWTCDDIPGRTVKMEQNNVSKSTKISTKTSIVDFKPQ